MSLFPDSELQRRRVVPSLTTNECSEVHKTLAQCRSTAATTGSGCNIHRNFATGFYKPGPNNMRHSKELPSCSVEQAIDFISAVKEIHRFTTQELNKLLRDSENFTICFVSEKGSTMKIDMEKFARFLPLHLIAVLMSTDRDEALFRYVLCGIRILHSLCDLAPKHTKLEQILIDDVKVSEELLDLVFYLIIVLSNCRQENDNSSSVLLLHSALVGCCLYLLTACIASQGQDLVQILLAHPKVDIFMDVAFRAVHLVVKFLQFKMSDQHTNFFMGSNPTSEQMVNYLCQQCEACVQFLQLLCQQKAFRERLLSNKELCGKGGVLFLIQSALKLKIPQYLSESSAVMSSMSRLKAKILSILLHLCEADNISYLDEVANSSGSLDLAKSAATEILELLKTELSKDPKHRTASSNRAYPTGLLQINAMRLADIFSDDSNFRSHITVRFTGFLSAVFSLSHGDFLSMWCSTDLPTREEDATLEYDSFAAAGWVLDLYTSTCISNPTTFQFSLISNNMSQASFVHQRTSLFVKIIANLHCFVPNICEEQERNLFLHRFHECLQMDPSKLLPGFSFTSGPQKSIAVSRNVRSLISHAESLIPTFLNQDDLQLLRVFFYQLQQLIDAEEFEENRVQEEQSVGGSSSLLLRREPPNANNGNGILKEEMSENSAFQEEAKFHAASDRVDQRNDVTRAEVIEDKDRSGLSMDMKEEREVTIVESSGSDTSSTRGKNSVDPVDNDEFPKLNEHLKESGLASVQEDEKVETVQAEEKQRRKRKRTIMNDKQVKLIERALLDEPEMQRNATSIQSWADRLSRYGSEVTCSQLRNWLNNRKAKLARASRDARAPSEADSGTVGKQGGQALGHSCNGPDSPREGSGPSIARVSRSTSKTGGSGGNLEGTGELVDMGGAEFVQCKPGQFVVLVDGRGEEMGKGKVHQVQGKWCGKSLEESETCVVDVVELKADRWVKVPYPCEATGSSFDEAERKMGVMRVMWDSSKIYMLRPQ